MKQTIILFIAIFFGTNAYSTHLSLVEGNDEKVCQRVFRLMISGEEKSFFMATKIISSYENIISWKNGLYLQKSSKSKNYDKVRVQYTKFDIDNDGKDEFIASAFNWSNKKASEYYKVLENEIPMDGSYKIAQEESNSWPGIYSMAPWQYKNKGLYLINIFPFKYKGTYYLGLKDTLFGKSNYMDRSFIVVKYSNKMLPTTENQTTSELDTVCKFLYVK